MTEYGSFRQRLDAVLRTLEVQQVKDFLIAENQWHEGQPADPEFAMWIMIGGAPTLHDLHERAYEWLMTHGHEADAKAFLARDKRSDPKTSNRNGKGGQKPATSRSTQVHQIHRERPR